jgi:toxin ParE1/3/4
MAQYHLSRDAKTDLLEIWTYIAEDSFKAADKLLDKFEKTFETLSQFPGMGRSRDELLQGIRSIPQGNYIIFYKLTNKGVEIHRVIHGARDISMLI